MHNMTMVQWQYFEALVSAHHNLHARHMSAENFSQQVAHRQLLASCSISSCTWLCQHEGFTGRAQTPASTAQPTSGCQHHSSLALAVDGAPARQRHGPDRKQHDNATKALPLRLPPASQPHPPPPPTSMRKCTNTTDFITQQGRLQNYCVCSCLRPASWQPRKPAAGAGLCMAGARSLPEQLSPAHQPPPWRPRPALHPKTQGQTLVWAADGDAWICCRRTGLCGSCTALAGRGGTDCQAARCPPNSGPGGHSGARGQRPWPQGYRPQGPL